MNKITKVIHSEIKRYKNFIKRLYYVYFGLNRDLILVYTMSKVGSSTVYNSLKKVFPYKEIHHLHFLGDTWLNKFESGHPSFNNNLKNASNFNDLLRRKKWNIKIITLTRDPIARDISGIFQAWRHIFDEEDINEVGLEKIINHLEHNDFKYPSNWFQTDFKEFTDIDIFQEPFNIEKGYQTYNGRYGPVLVMQLERLDDIFSKTMQTFLGQGNYTLQKENITAERSSGMLNKAVKNQFCLPDIRLDEIYSSTYCKTFYSASQIEKFKSKWAQ